MRLIAIQNDFQLLQNESIRKMERAVCVNMRRRKTTVYKRLIASGCFTLVLALILSIALFGFSTKASEDSNVPMYKYYTSIQITAGDTLWSLAQKYDAPHSNSVKNYINEVKDMNGLTDDTLMNGQYLIIPYYSDFFIE